MKDFTDAWKQTITEEEWKTFLQHTFNDNDRTIMWNWLSQLKERKSFAEIGFGQCFDFVHCFKTLHENNTIDYHGFDVTQQFADFANKSYPGFKFINSNFFDQDVPTFDIVYTRHVLEHQPPEQCYQCFERLLKRTKETCIVVWFLQPGKEHFAWNPQDGFGGTGAWVNHLDKDKIDNLIKSYNFSLKYLTPSVYLIDKN